MHHELRSNSRSCKALFCLCLYYVFYYNNKALLASVECPYLTRAMERDGGKRISNDSFHQLGFLSRVESCATRNVSVGSGILSQCHNTSYTRTRNS
jgi:hypothetical protein